jgi:hypothetical protein
MSHKIGLSNIHVWDGRSTLKALIAALATEVVLAAPAVLSPWGHAGPESALGWLSILVNLPGIFATGLLFGKSNVPDFVRFVVAFLIQWALLWYPYFVWLRWLKVREKSSLSIT